MLVTIIPNGYNCRLFPWLFWLLGCFHEGFNEGTAQNDTSQIRLGLSQRAMPRSTHMWFLSVGPCDRCLNGNFPGEVIAEKRR